VCESSLLDDLSLTTASQLLASYPWTVETMVCLDIRFWQVDYLYDWWVKCHGWMTMATSYHSVFHLRDYGKMTDKNKNIIHVYGKQIILDQGILFDILASEKSVQILSYWNFSCKRCFPGLFIRRISACTHKPRREGNWMGGPPLFSVGNWICGDGEAQNGVTGVSRYQLIYCS